MISRPPASFWNFLSVLTIVAFLSGAALVASGQDSPVDCDSLGVVHPDRCSQIEAEVEATKDKVPAAGNPRRAAEAAARDALLAPAYRLWTSVNDGAGSGLDADLLHNVSGAAVLGEIAGHDAILNDGNIAASGFTCPACVDAGDLARGAASQAVHRGEVIGPGEARAVKTTSQSWVPFASLSETLTTTGGPVLALFETGLCSFGNNYYSYDGNVQWRLLMDGQPIGYASLWSYSNYPTWDSASITRVVTPPAGDHAFTIEWRVIASYYPYWAPPTGQCQGSPAWQEVGGRSLTLIEFKR